MTPEERDQKGVFAEQVNRLLRDADNLPTFEVDGPHSLTIFRHSGQYAKRPFIGEEQFIPVSVYLGKRGDLIYCFRPNAWGPTEYKHIEVPGKDVENVFKGFREFLVRVLDEDDEATRAAARNEADEVEARAHAAALQEARMNDERYGSWG